MEPEQGPAPPRPPVHRTVLVADVEGFCRRRPTTPHRLAIRAGLYRALEEAFDDLGTPWTDWYREDRGDGLLLLVPPEVPKSVFAESLPQALGRALRRHNGAHGREEAIRLRVALHAGEVGYDEHGVAGASVDHAFRLLDSDALRTALARSPGELALVVSAWFYEEVVRNSPTRVHLGYRRVRVSVKETDAHGWVHVPGEPRTAEDDRPGRADAPFLVPTPAWLTVRRGALTDALLAHLAEPGDDAPPVVVVGPGGFGKTTLAVDVCRQPEVRALFPDGVLWLTAGENLSGPDLATKVNDLSEHLSGDRPALADPLQAGFHLGRLLGDRAVLLVVDDVWRPDQLAPFLQGGRRCRRLVTTRNRVVVPAGARRVFVDAMTPDEARELLTADLPHFDPGCAERLVAGTGAYPLLLALVNSQLRSLVADRGAAVADAVAEVAEELLAGGPTALDVTNPTERRQAVESTVEASLALLEGGGPARDRTPRYLELAVFPDDVDVPREVLETYWARTAGWHVVQVRRFCDDLAALSLIQSYRANPPRIRLHEVMRRYLRRRVADRLPALHAALLDAYRGRAGDGGWSMPPGERYPWRHVAWHLRQAGRPAELEQTVLDLRYAVGKILNTDVIALESDLALADGAPAAALRALVAQSAHLLRSDDPRAVVEATLLSRTAGVEDVAAAAAAFARGLTGPRLHADEPLPDRPDAALHRVLMTSGRPVNTVVFAPDGKLVAAAAGDGTVRLWDPDTGAQRHILDGHTDWVTSVAFSPTGHLLASASGDGTVRLWDTASGRCHRVLTGHTGIVEALAFHPRGRLVASAGADGAVRLWDTGTGAQSHVLEGHRPVVWRIAFSPTGALLASAGDDGLVRLGGAGPGELRQVLAGHGSAVQALVFSPDGTVLATGARDGAVRLWDVAARRVRHVLAGHANWVTSLAFSPDSRLLASTSWDRTARVWDTAGGHCLHTLGNHALSAGCAVFTPDGATLVTTAGDGTIHLWDAATGQERRVLTGHTKTVPAVAVDPDCRYLASASWDGSVRLWTARAGAPASAQGAVKAVAGSPDGTLLALACADGAVRLRDAAPGAAHRPFCGHGRPAHAVAFHPDGSTVASGGADGAVLLWRPGEPGAAPRALAGGVLAVRAVAFSPDGALLAAAGDDGAVRLWDHASGQVVGTWNGHAERVYALAWHPAGTTVAAAGDDGIVRLHDPATGVVTGSLAALTPAVHAVAFDPTGGLLAAGGQHGAVRLWDLPSGRRRELPGHDLAVEAVAFSPDGAHLASAGRDGAVRLWSAATAAFLTGIRVDSALTGLVWLPGGRRLVAVGARGTFAFSLVTP